MSLSAFNAKEKAATVGVMATSEYVFNTNDKEKMSVISGEISIQLDGEAQTVVYSAGESFDVPANSAFNVTATGDTAYLCVYG